MVYRYLTVWSPYMQSNSCKKSFYLKITGLHIHKIKTHCDIKEFEILKSLENSPERVHTFLRNLKSRDVNTYTDKEQW